MIDPPYTVPMYGTPFTDVPEYFTGWVSWFSGDATDLFPSLPADKARRMVELMGGADAVVTTAERDHEAGNHQLAAELTQLALRAEPGHDDARLLKQELISIVADLRRRGIGFRSLHESSIPLLPAGAWCSMSSPRWPSSFAS
ncbi:hypothetical protein NLM24_29195 [Nocardia zapadnayensis]|nr:alkyl sulfatase dimerization domain-containing protein [Nocardia zapadnayensis]MCX0274696.1 hypothetical protein [Nocardia zapadnayensis]